ncbi:MAG TPA: hypothetical protein VIG62_14780 [Blastocatellia bacterium]|jgi:2',3'-cyclic-nucleotide 2'-phosphodiesterase (5'-nucleotidase family)
MAALLAPALAGPRQAEVTQQQKAAVLDARLGEDDGAAAAILFGANMRGNPGLCDCNNPRGGLGRRIGYIEAFKKKFKQTPVLHVEAGNLFYNSEGYTPYIKLQNEQMARAFSRWPADVVNLSRYDLIFARKLLLREGLTETTTQMPVIKNMISANGVFEPEVAPPAQYLIKEVRGPRIRNAARRLRIGFIGLAEPMRPGAGVMDGTVKDMFESARQLVGQVRKSCDVLVIVAHSELKDAMKLAEQNPQVDIVIAGNAEGLFKPREVGKTLVLSAAPGNIEQGDLRIYIGKAGQISFKFRSTELDDYIPSDPAAAAFADTAMRERERIRYHQ